MTQGIDDAIMDGNPQEDVMVDPAPGDDGKWFAVKRYGYGSGLPIAWQGWVLMGAFLAAVLALLSFAYRPGTGAKIGSVAGILMVTLLFTIIVHRKTRGAYKWRWGQRDRG
jgi:hypothetical protein